MQCIIRPGAERDEFPGHYRREVISDSNSDSDLITVLCSTSIAIINTDKLFGDCIFTQPRGVERIHNAR